MSISSIFQGNQSSSQEVTAPGEGLPIISSYTDTVDVRTNFPIPEFKLSSLVRAFEALVAVGIEADTSLSETFVLTGTFDGANWSLAQISVNSLNGTANIKFTIDNTGQVFCTTTPTQGEFVKRTIAWNIRAI